MYFISDPSMIELFGAVTDANKTFVSLQFKQCSNKASCASKDEIRNFLSDKSLYVAAASNYIAMEDVLPEDETLKQDVTQLF